MNSSLLYPYLLEAPLVKKGFVSGEKKSDCEIYITELLNASSWMAEHYSLPFVQPETESHGECDGYAGKYGLDYKLIASKTALQARSIFSLQVSKETGNVTSFLAPKCSGGMNVTRIAQALRGQTIEELLYVQANAPKQQGVDNDIKEYMDTISVEKNLLLFFPYRFKFEEAGELLSDVQSINAGMQKDFAASLNYRARRYPHLDTYFLYLYDYCFALCQWENGCLMLLEIIPVEKSETFLHLALSYCNEWSEKYDGYLKEIESQNEKNKNGRA